MTLWVVAAEQIQVGVQVSPLLLLPLLVGHSPLIGGCSCLWLPLRVVVVNSLLLLCHRHSGALIAVGEGPRRRRYCCLRSLALVCRFSAVSLVTAILRPVIIVVDQILADVLVEWRTVGVSLVGQQGLRRRVADGDSVDRGVTGSCGGVRQLLRLLWMKQKGS